MIAPEDLGLIPTEVLIEALRKRYDTLIFGGIKDKNGASVSYKRDYSGNRVAALGLCRFVSMHIEAELNDCLEDDAEEAPIGPDGSGA